MTSPVFWVPKALVEGELVPLASVSPGATVVVEGDEGRHAAKVHRLRTGEDVDLVDGVGTRLKCEVVDADSRLTVRVLGREVQEAAGTPMILVQALAKGGRDEQAIETATELGVDGVIPWASNRAVVRWVGPKVDKGLERWNRVLVAAMKQSRRSTLPELSAPLDSGALAREVAQWTEHGDLVFVCHEQATVPLTQVLRERAAAVDATAGARIVVIVGPEGGIDDKELAQLTDAGAYLVALGPEVQRSSTAGPSALVVANVALGRW